MRRFALFAVIVLPSTMVFGQSAATRSGSSQISSKPSTLQWPRRLSDGQPGHTAVGPVLKNFDCHGVSLTQNQASALADLDHLFCAPFLDLKSHAVLFAFNENPFASIPLIVPPHPKAEPIPTQWPGAKFEQIPTQWPNLKLQPIDRGSSGSVAGHGSAK
ncbi:MAG: hypothetical protein ABSF70_07215 [Terracidiphilus sp.]